MRLIRDELAEVLRDQGFDADIRDTAVGVADEMTQDTSHYAQLWTDASYDQVTLAMKELGDLYTSCGHMHDCCGCWFLKSVRIRSMYDREGVAYLIYESYARNF